jgi:hypothetical protein
MMNGIDAMKEVDGMRELTIQSQNGEDGQLLISVSDTGVGLTPQQADKIFDAFFTTKTHGAGMGLRISPPSLNRTGAVCGLLTTFQGAQDFFSPYLPAARNETQLCRQPTLSPLTMLRPTSRSFKSIGQPGPSRAIAEAPINTQHPAVLEPR